MRLVRNTLANASGAVISVLITLLLTPLLIGELGSDAYGVWILATSLTFGVGYLSFADLGIEQAAVRSIAEARGGGDVRRAREAFSTTFAVFLTLAAVLAPVTILLADQLVGVFEVPAELEDEAVTAFALVAAQIGFDLPTRAFSAALEGAQRYGLWQVTRVLQAALLAALMAAVVLLGHGIDTLAAATLAGSGVVFLVTGLLTWRGVPDIRFSPRLVTRRALRELAGFGSQLFLFRLLSVLYRQMDRTVIGIALSASLVTTYEIANKFYASAALIESIATSSLVPAVAFASADRETLRDMLKRGTNYSLAATLPVAIAVIVFAEPLIRTWIGGDHTDAATPTRLLVAALIPSFLIAVGQTMLVGLGRIKTMLFLVAGWAALNLGLSIWLVHPLDVNGPILATLISSSLLLPAVTWLFLREVQVDLGEWLRDVVAPVLPAAAIQALVALALLRLAGETGSLLVVALLCAVTIAVFIAAYYRLGLDAIHRQALRSTLRGAAGLDAPGRC